MAFNFTLTQQQIVTVSATEIELNGEDISLRGGVMSENANRDIATVTGVAAARQSVLRELPANPGSFPRRPDWGGGLSGLLFKGATQSTRDRIVSRARSRLLVNPRIFKTHEVSTTVEDGGVQLTVRADALGGFIDEQTLIKPPGV
jgi:phage baseplate assembly protein W